jgi:hypothetical protein
MRRALMVVLLCLAAAPAGAQPAKPAANGLRGPLGVEAPAKANLPVTPAPGAGLPGPPPLQSTAPSSQCRQACDKDYYFCLAQEAADQCPATWSQCRAGCDAAARAPAAPAG